MKAILMFLALTSIGVKSLNAQTTATNFNCNDCSGNNHDLFTELDQGKIIVLAWVMPCGGCINPAQAAYDKVQTYATSNPGQVFFYLVDDYANSSCSSLTSWAIGNDMDSAIVFSNASISMSDYGTDGMPKIVVLAGTDHQIYYNVNVFSDGDGVQAAIDSALAESTFGINELSNSNFQLSLFPNPTNDKNILISYNLIGTIDVIIEIYDPMGDKVESLFIKKQTAGNYEQLFDLSNLTSGVYFIELSAGDRIDKLKFVVSQ
jgi:hypothetical protein